MPVNVRQFSFLLTWLAAASLVSACTDSQAPEPPKVGQSETYSGNGGSSGSGSGDGLDDNGDDFGDDDGDGADDGDDDGEGTSGAAVGSEAEQEAVSSCNADGRFYDRYADDGDGKCLKAKIAETSCDADTLLDLLNGSEKAAFKDAVEEKYDDYEIDQCLDCPPGNSIELCETDGKSRTGTKVFFVKETDTTFEGAARLLTIRPGASD
jgi:hypothetical protein